MIVYDLYCGLGGWSEAFLAEGYRCVGFDIEAHDYGSGGYPGELILRDVRQIHGSELEDATCIVGSRPCQEFSYRAMPWKRAKALPPPYLGMELFNAQFRIQREASAAAGHHIPMVVENVRGAQKWVGRAKANFGSFYLWGDVGMVGSRVVAIVEGRLVGGAGVSAGRVQKFNPDGTEHPTGSWFAIADSKDRGAQKREGRNFHAFENGLGSSPSFNGADHKTRGTKAPGIKLSEVGFNVAAAQRYREGVKVASEEGRRTDVGNGARFTTRDCGVEGIKQGGDWFNKEARANGAMSRFGSKSNSRKAASAMIAKIPYPLASYIAKSFTQQSGERPKGE